jgi:hypothetical protein
MKEAGRMMKPTQKEERGMMDSSFILQPSAFA